MLKMSDNVYEILLVIFCGFAIKTFVNGQGPICTGQILGVTDVTTTGATAGTESATSYLLLGSAMEIPCCGVVSEWRFAALADSDLTAQVWKNSAGNIYEVVKETVIPGVTTGATMRQGLSDTISVEEGYVFGWHSSGSDIPAYITDAAAAMGIVTSAGQTAVGNTNTWPTTLVDNEQWQFGVTLAANSVPRFTTIPAIVDIYTSDTAVITLAPSDDDPDDLAALSVTISPASAEFELTGNDVTVKSTLAVQDYLVVFEVSDHCLETATATLTVRVTDNSPVLTSLPIAAALELREDEQATQPLHSLTFTDVDTDLTDISCSINYTVPTPAPFVLKYKAETSGFEASFVPDSATPLDYDVNSFYEIYIVCNDGTSDSDVEMLQVDLIKNESPVPTIDPTIYVSAATTDAGTTVHTFTATDSSPNGDTVVFTIDTSSCNCPFDVTLGGELYATEDMNSHRSSPYEVNITVHDEYEGTIYNTVGPITTTIHITDINTPPNITKPVLSLPYFDKAYIMEHTDEGFTNLVGDTITVYTPEGSDDDGDSIEWSLEFNTGNGADLYEMLDNTTGVITSKKDLDYETLSAEGLLNTLVYLRAWDGREYSEETKAVQLIVNDENETPIFKQVEYAVETEEGTTTTRTLECPLFKVDDEDFSDSRSYDIDCGGIGHFQIPSTQTASCDAIVQQTQEHDLDDPGAAEEIVSCIITVSDKGDLTATATLVITVKEIDDNPPVLSKTAYTEIILNSTTAGQTFGTFTSTDDDFLAEHQRHTYTTDSNEFGAHEDGVFYSKVDWTDVNAPTTREFTLYATDDAGHRDSAQVTVIINPMPTTTTTTTVPTTIAATYDNILSFLDDPGNMAWLIPAILLGALMLGLMAFMCFKCCSPGACANINSGNCFGRGRHGMRGTRAVGQRTVVKRVPPREPRTVHRVVEDRRPVRVVESRSVLQQKPVQEAPLKEKSSIFDRFKSKPEPTAKAVDQQKPWHLWSDKDYQSSTKWVG